MSEEETDEVVVLCEGCGREMLMSESQCCTHCDMDGLGDCCIGDMDHACATESEAG